MALDMTLDEKAAKLLQQAQLLMNEGGKHWGKGHYRSSGWDGGYTYCAVGAIREVLSPGAYSLPTHNPVFNRAIEILARTINPALDPKADQNRQLDTIFKYNDAPERRWEGIRKTFSRAVGRLNRSK